MSSASTTVQRTAKECEIRWLGERHPQFNDTQWTKSEIAKVKELVGGAGEGQVDWVEVAEKLGVRCQRLQRCLRLLADFSWLDWTHSSGLYAQCHHTTDAYMDS